MKNKIIRENTDSFLVFSKKIETDSGLFFSSFKLISKNIFKSKNTTISFWTSLLKETPNGELLTNNIFNKTLKKDKILYLVSAIEKTRDETLKLDNLLAGMGCLGNVVYCVQSYKENENKYKLHNFGTYVMKHKKDKTLTPVFFKIDINNIRIAEINYLSMGELFNFIRKNAFSNEDDRFKKNFKIFYKSIDFFCGEFISECIDRFNSTRAINSIKEAEYLIDKMSALIPRFNYFSYIYFEAVSLALMLNSYDKSTLEMKDFGEFNNSLYINFIHKVKEGQFDKKFEIFGSSLKAKELVDLIMLMKKDFLLEVSNEKLLINIANNIIMYLGTSLPGNKAIKGMAFYDFCVNTENSSSYKTYLNKCTAYSVSEYMKKKSFDLVINSTIEKGEIGINTHIASNKIEFHLAEYSKDLKKISLLVPLNLKLRPIENFI